MFGSRNAASNASIDTPAPNAVALRLSRASPVIRDSSVIALTVVTERSRLIGRRAGGAANERNGNRSNRASAVARGIVARCALSVKLLLCLVFFCGPTK